MKRALYILSILSLILFLVTSLVESIAIIKPTLILGFAFLALASARTRRLKGFTFSFWILTAVCASMIYPDIFTGIGDFKFKLLIVPLLQIIMFGMGSQMSLNDLAGVVKMPRGVIIGVLCQFTIMPIVGFTIAKVFSFPPEIAAGIVLVGCSPGGLASNVMSFIARANLALSITITTIGTLLSPFLTPLLMKVIAGELVEINVFGMMAGIFNMVILPICAGLIFNLFLYKSKLANRVYQMAAYLVLILLKNLLGSVSGDAEAFISVSLLWDLVLFWLSPIFLAFLFKYLAKGKKEILDKMLSYLSMVGITVIIIVITAAGHESLLKLGALLILATFLHNTFGYLLGFSCGRIFGMQEKDCRTIALEVGMQNGGLASGLALEMGKIATVGLAPAVFGPMMNITGSSLASWWRNRTPKETINYTVEQQVELQLND